MKHWKGPQIYGLKEACPTPPEPGIFVQAGRIAKVIQGLLRSISDNPFWSLLYMLLVCLILISAFILPTVSQGLRIVAEELDGKRTTVLEMRIPGRGGIYVEFHDFFLHSEEEQSSKYFFEDWRMLFSEEDVSRIEEIEGVETVVRVIRYNAFAEHDTEEFLGEKKENILKILHDEEYASYRSGPLLQQAECWNMTVEDYLNRTCGFTHSISILCTELSAIKEWVLPFNEVVRGRFIKPNETDSIMIIDWELGMEEFGTVINGSLPLIIGQSGWYNSSGEVQWFDNRHIYVFKIVGSIPNSMDINALANLESFINIFKEERNEEGPPMPLYTELYVKTATPLDSDSVEKRLNELYPNKRIMRLGYAPMTICETLQRYNVLFGILFKDSMILLGFLLLVSQMTETYAGRKKVWVLKARGWDYLDLISYTFLRMAIIGVVAGVITLLIIGVAGHQLLEYMIKRVTIDSPEITRYLVLLINAIRNQTRWYMPLQGITALVITGFPSIVFLLFIKPPKKSSSITY